MLTIARRHRIDLSSNASSLLKKINKSQSSFECPSDLSVVQPPARNPTFLEQIDRPPQQLAGYITGIRAVDQWCLSRHWKAEDIVETLPLELHGLFFSNAPGSGQWRERPIEVVGTNGQGDRSMVHQGLAPDRINSFITDLFTHYREALSDIRKGHIDPLIVAGLVVLDFLAIHGLPDGNGRTARKLTDLICLSQGHYFPYVTTFETAIKRDYLNEGSYRIADSLKGWHQGMNNPTPWIEYFLENIRSCQRIGLWRMTWAAGASRIERFCGSLPKIPLMRAEVINGKKPAP